MIAQRDEYRRRPRRIVPECDRRRGPRPCARQRQESSGIQGDVGGQHDRRVEHMLHDGPETTGVDADQGAGGVH